MRKNTHKFKRAITTAYLVAGLSVSSGQNEVKPKTPKSKASSEKIDNQKSPNPSDPLLSRINNISHKISTKATNDAVDAAIRELNSREALTWGKAKLAPQGFNDDASTFQNLNQSLGGDYLFSGTASGGAIAFLGSEKFKLTRTPSTAQSPGRWERAQKKPKDHIDIKEIDELVRDLPEGSMKSKFSKTASNLKQHEVDAAILELNSREALIWGEALLSPKGFINDATVFKMLDQKLGDKYPLKITAAGGSIIYHGGLTPGPKVILKRTPSTATSPGSWERTSKKPAK